MEVDAATLFNFLGKRYEDAYANNPYLHAIVKRAMRMLKPGSQILDVGCGTGKPVAEMLTSEGHNVHGIDVAEEMVKIAQSQVRGSFEVADMRNYQPVSPFDAVFAVYSLYQLSPSDTYSMVFRFAEWLKPGGVLVLGTTPSTSLPAGLGVDDPVWECVRGVTEEWMTKLTKQTFLSESGWEDLLGQAGFDVEATQAFKYVPMDQEHNPTEVHHFVVAKHRGCQPLFGPYPLPQLYPGPRIRDAAVWGSLQDRLVNDEVAFDLISHKTILDIGGGLKSFTRPLSCARVQKSLDEISESLPFEDKRFDSAYAIFALEHVNDPKKVLRELARVVDPAHPCAQITIIQGAPYNECLKLLNSVCAPLSKVNSKINHQGFLLHTAKNVLSDFGFGNVSIQTVESYYAFDEDHSKNSETAAEELAGLWYKDDPNYEQMKTALVPHVRELFVDHPGILRNESVMLIARSHPN